MAILLDPSPSSLFDLRTILTATAIVVFGYLASVLYVYPIFFSPLRKIPGPGRGNLFFGHLPRIFKEGPGVPHREWMEKYKSGVVRYFAGFGAERLMVSDPKALHHMLVANAYDFPKSEMTRMEISRLLGKGVLFVEGEDHRRQRRIMNPAFINSHIARLVPIFFEKSQKLVDIWVDLVNADQSEKKGPVVNIEKYLSRCTLDIIGKAGFDYDFGALSDSENALAKTFGKLMGISGRRAWYFLPMIALMRVMPFLMRLPNERLRRINANMEEMVRESTLIVENKQASDPEHTGRDLLSLLLKANESEGKMAMSMEELRGQLTTFILAGHETTATALSWVLYELAQRPEVQNKLREEIRAAGLKPSTVGKGLSFDHLNSLPYLDAVVRENMRINAPVAGTLREATADSVIPLSKPLPDGSTSFYVKANQMFFLSILAINTSTALFGDDALEFKPERWLDGRTDKAQKETASYTMWGSQLSFLSGTRGCIGYRFAISELKGILASLLTTFSFELGTEEGEEIIKRSTLVTKPYKKGSEDEGAWMPMRIRLVPE